MAVKQLPTLSPIPESPNRLVGDQERFDTMTFNSLKAQEKMVNVDLNQNVIPALNQFAVDVNASVDAAKASETSALASKNSAASSAGTATTKAGEAAASAKAAKTSETSALASKNAASSSATAAANAQKAAEAARDEAQDLANVGYASESRAGLAKVDGKTTQAAADGAITVKDVAIGGDLGDLASARGQIGPARELGNNVDFNTVTEAGLYLINATGSVNAPRENQAFFLQVVRSVKGAITKNLFQIAYNYSTVADLVFIRQYRMASSSWSVWTQFITSSQVGDGLTVNNGIISVPEYVGATASAAGTSGLVPPAAAGQQNHLLTGGGAYISKVPNATHADTADNSLALAGRPWLESLYTDSAGWLIGSVDEKLRPVNTGSLKVYYANSAGSAPANGGTSWATTVVPNVAFVGTDGALPNGGTWHYVYMPYDTHYLCGVTLAGGDTAPSNEGGIAIRIA